MELLERHFQVLVIVRCNRIESAEDHWLHVAKARERRLGPAFCERYRVPDSHLGQRLDAGHDQAHLSRGEHFHLARMGIDELNALDVALDSGDHQAHRVSAAK